MANKVAQTGFNIKASIFDTTGLENPFYETTSQGDTLIELMKNNLIIINEVEIVKKFQEIDSESQDEKENKS